MSVKLVVTTAVPFQSASIHWVPSDAPAGVDLKAMASTVQVINLAALYKISEGQFLMRT